MSVSKTFILAGQATFTVNTPDKGHRTFRVEKVEATAKWPEAWFVKTLVGPDNTEDFAYLGKLDPFTGQVATTFKSASFADSFRLKLLNRILARVWGDDQKAFEQHGYTCQHEGKCGRCGRTLTVPSSIDNGIGPDCAEKMGLVCAKPKKVKKSKKVAEAVVA